MQDAIKELIESIQSELGDGESRHFLITSENARVFEMDGKPYVLTGVSKEGIYFDKADAQIA